MALQNKGYDVWGTTTGEEKQAELRRKGIQVWQWRLDTDRIYGGSSLDEVWRQTTFCILNIPPGLRKSPAGSFLKKIQAFTEYLEPYTNIRLIFISSTSVFGKHQGAVNETTPPEPDSPGGEELHRAENWIRSWRRDTTILRPGGLIGPDRHPVYSLSGRSGLRGGQNPVNLVHREDCIAIILEILDKGYTGEIIHAVYPDHPTRFEYYTGEALNRGLPAPEFESIRDEPGKIVHSAFLSEKGFSYTRPISTVKS
jgi:nucleoside-diphosphate-sugar epimerase